jgi:WD40 repeat protein
MAARRRIISPPENQRSAGYSEIVPRTSMPINSRAPRSTRVATAFLGLTVAACSGHGLPPTVVQDDAHTNSAWTVTFARALPLAASGGAEGRVRLWRLPEAKPLGAWPAHEAPVTAMAFINADSALLSASEDASLARWDLSGGLLARVITPAAVTTMVADAADNIVISGHADGAVRIWRLDDFTLHGTLTPLAGAIQAVAYHSTTGRLATSGADGRVLIGPPAGPLRELPRAPGATFSLAFSPDGNTLTGSGWFRLFQWTLASQPSLRVLTTAHRGLIRAVRYSPDGLQLATISRLTDSAVLLLDAPTGAIIWRLRPHDLCGRDVAFSPDGRYLASTSDDASVRFWDLSALPAKQ